MLFSLQKTLGLLLMPCGFLGLILIAATLWIWRRKQRGPALLLSALTLLFTFFGNQHIGSLLMRPLEQAYPPCDWAQAGPFDAVFVLGGGTELDPIEMPILGSGGDRVFAAARLWHAGRTQILVASGAGKDSPQGMRDLGQETRTLWMSLGIPDQAIQVIKKPCFNTREEIQQYTALCQQKGFKHIALLSSASQLKRAMALAKRHGLASATRITALGADYQSRKRAFQFQDLVPQERGFRLSQTALWEWVGRLKG